MALNKQGFLQFTPENTVNKEAKHTKLIIHIKIDGGIAC